MVVVECTYEEDRPNCLAHIDYLGIGLRAVSSSVATSTTPAPTTSQDNRTRAKSFVAARNRATRLGRFIGCCA